MPSHHQVHLIVSADVGFIFGFLAEKSGNISPIKSKSQQYNKLLGENTIRTQCMDPTLNPEYFLAICQFVPFGYREE